jgi:endoglucanase
VTAAHFADFWSKLSSHYKSNSKIIFGIMNEPNEMQTETWLADANAAIAAIRNTGATNLLLVPGNSWTGGQSWAQDWYGTSNAQVMQNVVDPLDNYFYDIHQYLDENYSGQLPNCYNETIGVDVSKKKYINSNVPRDLRTLPLG